MTYDPNTQCYTPQQPTIVNGEDKTLEVKLISEVTGDPIDITAADEILAIFLNNDNTFLEKKLSTAGIAIISGPGGHFQIILTSAETALLQPTPTGSYTDIECHLTIGGKKSIIIFKDAILVVPRRYNP